MACPMSSIPVAERPRERLVAEGERALSDHDLVAILLGSGCRGASAIDVAREVMASYGDLGTLGRAQVADLSRIQGVGPARACALAAALELGRRAQAPRQERTRIRVSSDVDAMYAPRLRHLTHEVFHVLCLDVKHRVIRDTRVVEGGLTTCSVLPREVYAPALREAAAAVVFVHNHPSGDPTPSAEDLSLTARLKQAGAVLGIKALDHLVIGDGRYVSLVDEGLFASL